MSASSYVAAPAIDAAPAKLNSTQHNPLTQRFHTALHPGNGSSRVAIVTPNRDSMKFLDRSLNGSYASTLHVRLFHHPRPFDAFGTHEIGELLCTAATVLRADGIQTLS